MDQPAQAGSDVTDLPFSAEFLAQYELLDVLGEGGMGLVLLAKQRGLDREVAIKVLKSLGPDEIGRFAREGRLLSGLAHPRILKVLDAGVDAGLPYIVFERLVGRTLEAELRAGSFTLGDALALGAKIADALAFAHSQGVVHRDVKPDNVFLLEGREIKLADFGLARDAGSRAITSEGTMLGTPDYMAPEQARGDPATPASDQFSLGVTIYRLACHALPYAGGAPIEVAVARIRTDPKPIHEHCPAFPPAVEDILMRALAREPKNRWPSLDAFRAALEGAREGLGSAGERVFRPKPKTGRSAAIGAPGAAAAAGSNRGTIAAVVLAVLVTGLNLAWRPRAPAPAASPSGQVDLGLADARGALLDALDTLRPLEQVEELRKLEQAVRGRSQKQTAAERTAQLRQKWREHFDGRLARSRLVPAALRFRPTDALHQRLTTMEPSTWLALQNHVEDLAFLCYGLQKLELPQPLEPSAASRESAHVALEPPVKYDYGTGFRLPRKALGEALPLDSDPRGGPVDSLDHVPPRGAGLIDDRFFTHAIVMGEGNEIAAIHESFEKIEERDRLAQVTYTHPKPIEIPDPATIEAAAISAFVSDLDPEHRFEVYLANDPAGPFRRRLATFRGSFHKATQLWCPVEPSFLPPGKPANARLLYLHVRFTTLPGLPNPHDDAELHQVTLHVKRRP